MQEKISHILIFEPRLKGHHLSWLKTITNCFVSQGFKISLATDYRGESRDLIQNHLSGIIDKISIMSVFEKNGQWYKGGKIKSLSNCFHKSNAQEIFMNNLDEIMSHCLRLSAFGLMPPENLKGRLSGVYFRPRFIENNFMPPGNIIKSYGFRRLCKQSWFKNIYFMDEYLHKIIKDKYPDQSFYFLPDFWEGHYSHDRREARNTLELPQDKLILLFFGIGDKRKGLQIAVNALLSLPEDSNAFLLCVGSPIDSKAIKGLEKLKHRGMAFLINRYVSEYEKELCFCASDLILLPYINHFGSSGVLSLASAAGKMVIASDFGLLGRRVKEHHLGFTFKNGDTRDFVRCLKEALSIKESRMARHQQALSRFSNQSTLQSFANALMSPYRYEHY